MTGRKLEKMLRELPGLKDYNKIVLLTAGLLFGGILVMFAFTGLLKEEGAWAFIIFLAPGGTILTYIIMAIILALVFNRFTRAGRKLKENGEKSLRFLKNKGLLDAAAAEYANNKIIECKAAHRDGRMDRFVSRRNALTPNFIFIMSENAILPYAAVTAVKMGKYQYTYGNMDNETNIHSAVTHTNDVLTIKTVDNCEYDLLNINNGMFTQKRYDAIVGAINLIKQKNPDCYVPEISSIAANIKN